jgi:hypothetical protein
MNNDRAWAATRKGLFELRRRGGRWTIARTSFLGEPVSAVLPPDGSGRMLAALNLGHFGVKLHRSDDAGATWTEVATPAYPEQPADATGPAWKLLQVWTLEAAHGRLWAGTLPGGLFVSDDFGTSWQLQRSLWDRPERLGWFGGGYDVPGVHSVCAHPTDPQHLLIGISCGGAWTSHDGGDSWALTAKGMRADFMPPEQREDGNTQDPHRIVRCPAAPQVLWCQHHCGIWKSTNGGTLWTEVTTAPVSKFGFAVAVHPQDPDTAWFVPAIADQCRVPVDGALVVNRTRDGGRSFETLREGLPQTQAYDLMYRHALDVGSDGRTLLMGSTTGGLWASGDGGEVWQTVSVNLPMIHAVRVG